MKRQYAILKIGDKDNPVISLEELLLTDAGEVIERLLQDSADTPLVFESLDDARFALETIAYNISSKFEKAQAAALSEVRNEAMKRIEIAGDGSKWGLVDLYEDVRLEIEAAWNSCFEVAWGSKKEIAWAKIRKSKDQIEVWAGCSCDEDFDLISDAFWSVAKIEDRDEALFEEIYDAVTDWPSDILVSDPSFEATGTLPVSATLDDCLELISRLYDSAESDNQANFQRLCAFVKPYVPRLREALEASEV